MATLSDAKMLGGLGSILMLLGIIHSLIAIIGLVLFLIAVKFISDITKDENIFRNMLYAVVIGSAGIVASFVIFLAIFAVSGVSIVNGFAAGAQELSNFGIDLGFIGGLLAGLAVIWITFLISALFAKRSYDKMANGLGVRIFSTAGLLYLIGAALVIIFGIGLVLVLVAVILTIVGFFSIPDQLGPAAKTQETQPAIQQAFNQENLFP